MGVAERKERHKEELKKEILNAAKALYLEKGYEATSIRNIAEKIEYSPATVYLYYKDKDEIMHGLHREGFKMLQEYFQSLFGIADPFVRLKALGKAYIQFALDQPEMYKLIFLMEEPMAHVDKCLDEEWDEGQGAYESLYNTVKACQEVGYFKEFETHGISFMIWSTMHGLCTLRNSCHLEHMQKVKELKPDTDSLMDYIFETFTKVLESLKK